MSFTDIFGGENINPTQLNYIGYTSAVSLTLVWPYEAVADSFIAASKVDMTMTTAGKTLTLPSAALVSVGQDIMIANTGAEDFDVLDADGDTLQTVEPFQFWLFYVIDNSDAAGTWRSVQYAGNTGASPTAADLAGAGLSAILTTLNQNLLTAAKTTTYTVLTTDRAKVLMNTAGAITFAFTAAATLGNGFFFYAINSGSGALTLNPSGTELIDGALTKTLAAGENCVVFCNGSAFYSLGYGRLLTTTISASEIDISSATEFTLTSPQISAQVQNFVGTPGDPVDILYGGYVGYWFVHNGSDSIITLFAGGDDPTGVEVGVDAYAAVRSDGTLMNLGTTP